MKRRILYVEDCPNHRLLVKRIIQAAGFEMLEARDGESGWNVAIDETPDFILTDLLMPGMDGFELIRRIKARPELSHIAIVTLTAYGNPETERIAKAAGCDGFLHKPATIRQIQAVLRQFLGACPVQ